MTKEKAIEEIEAIYKLAGLSGCFIVGSIEEKAKPQLHYINFVEDAREKTPSPLEIAAMCTASLSPLYQAICLNLAITGMSLSELTPKSWDQESSYRWYLDESFERLATGTLQTFYERNMKSDKDIPDVFKEYMEKLMAPLKS